jgi:hypothetical protein
VLTDLGHDRCNLIYSGRLRHFSLNHDGTFAYIVLKLIDERFLLHGDHEPSVGVARALHVNDATRAAGENRLWVPLHWVVATCGWTYGAIGQVRHLRPKQSSADAASATKRASPSDVAQGLENRVVRFIETRRTLRPLLVKDDGGTLLVLAGNAIKNVLFDGLFQVGGIGEVRNDAREAKKQIQDAGQDPKALEDALAQVAQIDTEPLAPRTAPAQRSTRDLQLALTELGTYRGLADGRLGPLTRRGVVRLQRAHGLKPDGSPGPDTWAAIDRALRTLHARRATSAVLN